MSQPRRLTTKATKAAVISQRSGADVEPDAGTGSPRPTAELIIPTAITKGMPRSPDSYRDRNRPRLHVVSAGRYDVGLVAEEELRLVSCMTMVYPLSTFTLTNCNFTASQPGIMKPNPQ
ncbi:MAG: hypothetical protein RIE59_20990 [Imperialibacter sp.]